MERLEAFKRRLGPKPNAEDRLLTDLLEQAESFVVGYTGREQLPPGLEGAVMELAVMAYNRLGMEGEGSHREGELTVGVDSLPGAVKALLDRFRLARVV